MEEKKKELKYYVFLCTLLQKRKQIDLSVLQKKSNGSKQNKPTLEETKKIEMQVWGEEEEETSKFCT